jgi:GT2 family glycosyltransferase
MAGDVDISVVIPTRERWPVLQGTLQALAEQDLDGVRAEVVVADNWSRDGSRVRARALAASLPFPLTVVCEPRRGPGPPRNAGIAAAAGDLVLFIGDDCRPASPRFVASHAEAHSGSWSAVQGHVAWDPRLELTPVMRWLAATDKLFDWERPALYTSNVSLPRAALLEVGGFDQRFDRYGWEDYELCLRLADRGVRLRYRPDLLVHHDHRYERADSLRRMDALGQTANLFHRLHPGRGLPDVPAPQGLRGLVGRALAPATRALGFRASHFAALVRGYGRARMSSSPELRGGPVARQPLEARPAVSVILPFHGSPAEGAEALAALGALRLRPADELILVDNTPAGAVSNGHQEQTAVLAAPARQSSYHARNRGAERARNDWLLFVDADCRLPPSLLDDYFRAGPVPEGVGAVAGAVVGDPDQDALAARYARSRRHLDQADHLREDPPYAITANLLVRRDAWSAVGGFAEGVRSGGDTDFSWRLQDAGWRLAYRHEALVEHRHRESVRALARQHVRYGAGWRWLGRPRPRIAGELVRAAGGAAAWTATLHWERAAFKALDGVVVLAGWAGWWWPNERRATGAASDGAPSPAPAPPSRPRRAARGRANAPGRRGAAARGRRGTRARA